MFSTLRNRFGIPGVISVIALVFAMIGGAYAASDNSGGSKATASAKAKKGPRGPKGATGPAGAAGPAGPAGPAGAKGDNGAAGANGSAGAAGPTGPTGAAGSKGATGATGATGFSGFTTTLPVGSTETGSWSFYGFHYEFGLGTAAISFPIPLAAPLDAAHVHYSTEENFGDFCDGTPEAPTAPSGELCIYQTAAANVKPAGGGPITTPGGVPGAGVVGAFVPFAQDFPEFSWAARGVFAVTG